MGTYRKLVGFVAALFASAAFGQSAYIANVLNFGADPTGVRDSTASINAAASYQVQGKYANVYFPTGTYLVSGQLNKNDTQCFYGDGWMQSTIHVTPSFATGQSGVIVDVHNSGQGNVGFECIHDLEIQGDQPQPISSTANGNTPSGTAIVVNNAAVYANTVGWYLVDFTTQNAIPANTTILSVVGNTINVSQSVTGILTGDTLTAQVSRAKVVPLGTCDGVRTGCQYPPFIFDNIVATRPLIYNLFFYGCWDGIIVPVNAAPTIKDIKSGCVDIGLQLGSLTDGNAGPKDFVIVRGWHQWNGWGWTSGAATFSTGLSAWNDGATKCMEVGRVDGGNFSQIACVMSALHLNTAHASSVSPSEFTNVMLDGNTSFLLIDGGYIDEFVNFYTGGSNYGLPTLGTLCPINITGGTTILTDSRNVTTVQDLTPEICNSGGWFQISNARWTNNNVTLSPITSTGSGATTNVVANTFGYPSNTTLTAPIIAITGGSYSIFDNRATGISGGAAITSTADSSNDQVYANNWQSGTFTPPGNQGVYGPNGSDTNFTAGTNSMGWGKGACTVATGAANTCVGHNSGNAISSGTQNTAVGNIALSSITTQSNNTAVGHGALQNSTGGTNVAVGTVALGTITSGNSNVAVGYQAGNNLTSVSNSDTIVGAQCNASGATASNEVDICAGSTALLQCTGGSTPGTSICTFAGTLTATGAATLNGGATVTGATTLSGGAVNVNASSNFATNIGTGTTTQTVTIGNSANQVNFKGALESASAPQFTVAVSGTNCTSASPLNGGAQAGRFSVTTGAASAVCTITITMAVTANNDFGCYVVDVTDKTVFPMSNTATSTTTCQVQGTQATSGTATYKFLSLGW